MQQDMAEKLTLESVPAQRSVQYCLKMNAIYFCDNSTKANLNSPKRTTQQFPQLYGDVAVSKSYLSQSCRWNLTLCPLCLGRDSILRDEGVLY